MTDMDPRGLVGKPVKVWVGVRLAFGLPERGVVRQYLPDFPGGPTYEVAFSEGDVPFSCLKPEWVFPASESTGSEEGR